MKSPRVAVVAAFVLGIPVVATAPASAHNTPADPLLFEMPFRCGEEWQVATYAGHGDSDHATDWNQGSGADDRGMAVVASYGGTVRTYPLSDRSVAADPPLAELLGPYGIERAGNYVVIDHGRGWTTRYLHLESITVPNGSVHRGQQIGTVGATGSPGAYHLDYQQELNGIDQHVTFNRLPIVQSYVYNGPTYRSNNCNDGHSDGHGVGAVRSVEGQSRWYLDFNRNGASEHTVTYGLSSDGPVSGDWDGDGVAGIGAYRSSSGMWYLDYDNDGRSNATVRYGAATDVPLAGDWDGDGVDDIGVFRPSEGRFLLDVGPNGSTDIIVTYGLATDVPVVGDWNNDGRDTVGVFRPSNGRWYLDNNNDGRSEVVVSYGRGSDRPVVGDWDGEGGDSIGVFRPSNGAWHLDHDSDGRSDETVIYGISGDRPVAGGWRLN